MTQQDALDRRKVVARLLQDRKNLLLVTGLGSPTYDAMAAGDDDLNFYLWGAMGSAAMIGFGLAMAQPDRPVLVLTGDGEMLMGLGSLVTIGIRKPRNLTIVVLDNEHYGETGMQPSHTSSEMKLDEIARVSGFGRTEETRETNRVESMNPTRLVSRASKLTPIRRHVCWHQETAYTSKTDFVPLWDSTRSNHEQTGSR